MATMVAVGQLFRWCVSVLDSAPALLHTALVCLVSGSALVVSAIRAQSISVTVKRRFGTCLLLFGIFDEQSRQQRLVFRSQ